MLGDFLYLSSCHHILSLSSQSWSSSACRKATSVINGVATSPFSFLSKHRSGNLFWNVIAQNFSAFYIQALGSKNLLERGWWEVCLCLTTSPLNAPSVRTPWWSAPPSELFFCSRGGLWMLFSYKLLSTHAQPCWIISLCSVQSLLNYRQSWLI